MIEASVLAAFLFAALVCMADFLGVRSGPLAALAELRPHAVFVSAFAVVATPLLEDPWALPAGALIAAYAAWPLVQYRLAKFEPVVRGEGRLTMALWNAGGRSALSRLWGGQISDRAIDKLAGADVELLLLMEVSDDDIARFRARHPHYGALTKRGARVHILIKAARAEEARLEARPGGAVLRLTGGAGKRFALFALHAPFPTDRERPAFFNALARDVAAEAAKGWRVAVAGDLNAGPFGPAFRKLIAEGSLRDPARGRRPFATWPVPIFGLGLQIDHVLVSEGVAAIDYGPGPWLRSDHNPVRADLRW